MKYFTKYLPVEGEIKNGDKYITENGVVRDTTYQTQDGRGVTIDKTHDKKVKLFLCSRDIQVGDTYLTAPDYSKERICEDVSYDFSNCLKVIGEISLDALSYVKEGDVFIEEYVKKGYNWSRSLSGPVWRSVASIAKDMGDNYEKDFMKGETPVYQITGPCGHFH